MQATIRKSNKVRRSKGDVIFDTVVYIITGLMILIAIYPISDTCSARRPTYEKSPRRSTT